jgi:hypothetical protein
MQKTKILLAAALLLGACSEDSATVQTREPLGIRQPLHPGLWRGAIGGTLVDFRIDQVSAAEVNVKISGQVMQPLPKSQQPPGYQPYFYDRPKVCSIKYDRHTFDCPHYSDMHIDNGLLCGTYTLESSVYHPCLQPVS